MSVEQVEELGYYYPLFKFFSDEHGLSLLDSQLQDVIHECKKFIEPASPSVKADGWVSVEEKPLITKDENNNWTCTEDGDKEFIAAVPYTEKMKDGTYKDKWWIHHCIIEDEVGLYIVDDEGNTPAGWSIEDVTHWQPLPNPPKQQL
jgi:hypothetical protein